MIPKDASMEQQITDTALASFLSEFPCWQDRLAGGDCWLGLPRTILDGLGDLKGEEIPNWLNNNHAWGTEVAFTDFLEARSDGSIGVRDGAVVTFPPFARLPQLSSLVTDKMFKKMGWHHTEVGNAQNARNQLDKAQGEQGPLIKQRLFAYAGWLTTNPIYLKEEQFLRERWESLSERIHFPLTTFPLGGSKTSLHQIVNEDDNALPNVSGEVQTFVRGLAAFLRRWGIVELAEWGFPVPQGPLFGDKDILSFVRNNDLTGQVVYIPSWYEVVASRDNVLDTLRRNQQSVQDDRFIEGDGWPISHYDRYAGMFLAIYAQRAIEQRGEKLKKGTPRTEGILKVVTKWLEAELPEPRGRGKKGKADGGIENSDDASRARRLFLLANQRQSGKMPKELLPRNK
jgi:hypothetical protein